MLYHLTLVALFIYMIRWVKSLSNYQSVVREQVSYYEFRFRFIFIHSFDIDLSSIHENYYVF